MAKNQIPTHANMVSAGFTQVSGTSTLYRHPTLPDLVFKRVPSIAAAVACGGVLCLSDLSSSNGVEGLMQFGDYALTAFHGGKIGGIAVATRLIASPLNTNFYWANNPGGASNQISGQPVDSCWTVHTSEWWDLPFLNNDSYVVGIVSRALNGVAVRSSVLQVFSSDETTHHPQYIPGNATHGAVGTYQTSLNSLGATNVTTSNVGIAGEWYGFVDAPITIDAKALIVANRSAYLNTVEGGEIRERYAKAFDDELALNIEMKSVEPARLWFNPQGGLTARSPVRSTLVANSEMAQHNGNGNLLLVVQSTQDGHVQWDRYTSTQDPYPEIVHVGPRPGDRAATGVTLPLLFSSMKSNPFSKWPTVVHNAHNGVSELELRVPYLVTLNDRDVPAGGVFGMVSPALRKVESTESLDFIGQLRSDINRVREIELGYALPVNVDDELPDVEKANMLDKGLASESLRRAAVDQIIPSLRPAVGAIVRFANRVDERVAAEIKG